MKTQHQIYLEKIEKLLLELEEDSIPHVIRMIEVLASEHKRKPHLRLVVA